MAPFWTVGLLFAVCVVPLRAIYYCSYTYTSSYCDYGCCTYDCCGAHATDPANDPATDPDININFAGWVIGLIVTGSVVFICIVVALICCCIKSQSHAGRVVSIQPQPQSGVTVISSGQQQSSHGNQGYVYNSGNPGYTQAWSYPPGQSAPPPPPAYSAPAYPPGQSNDPFAAAASSKH